jgi:hypothetical protein
MAKVISVPASYNLYRVEDDLIHILEDGSITGPPLIVLEVMVMAGQAERIGAVGTVRFFQQDGPTESEQHDHEDDPPEGMGPWVTE